MRGPIMKWVAMVLPLAFFATACGAPEISSIGGGETSSSFAQGAAHSTRPGMGATVSAGVVTFRVWAPNATAVSVVGDFNSWDDQATPLGSEGNGNFSADVP